MFQYMPQIIHGQLTFIIKTLNCITLLASTSEVNIAIRLASLMTKSIRSSGKNCLLSFHTTRSAEKKKKKRRIRTYRHPDSKVIS
jgi:hypothetical protein